jgi:hypothetical protein
MTVREIFDTISRDIAKNLQPYTFAEPSADAQEAMRETVIQMLEAMKERGDIIEYYFSDDDDNLVTVYTINPPALTGFDLDYLSKRR